MEYSIFIRGNGFRKESHDLTERESLIIAMNNLYEKGKLKPHVNVEIRNCKGIYFSANNP